MIRALRPTDLLTLLLLSRRLAGNEARTSDRLRGGVAGALSSLFKTWLPLGDKRHSLVVDDDGHLEGMVSARSRRGPGAWEIDLFLPPSDQGSCLDLMEGMSLAGSDLGVDRIFLTLDSTSPLMEVARRAGFAHYDTQYLCRFEQEGQGSPSPSPQALRPRAGSDEYDLFRMYSAAAPPQVRSAEGMTFQEWRQCQNRDAQREMVCEQNGQLVAWLRIRTDGNAGLFEVMYQPEGADPEQLLGQGLLHLGARQPLFCLASEFQGQLRQLLLERGFAESGERYCLVKQLAARVHEPQFVPLKALEV